MMQEGLPMESDLGKDSCSLYEGVKYERFWSGLPKNNLDRLEHAIVCNLLPVSAYRIIDVGCGYGRLTDCYMDRFQQVIMVDGSMSLLHQAYENTKGQAIYIACDVHSLPFRSASFDVVLMIRVFHHIEDSQACIFELNRLLCNEGRIIFSYFNKTNIMRVIRWVIGTGSENPFTKEPAGVGTTLISHHPGAVHLMLRESGFSNIQSYGVGVLDRLVGGLGVKAIGVARQLAPFFAWSRIAPWILCSSIAIHNASLEKNVELSNILQCPVCGGYVEEGKNKYQCVTCNSSFPITDGIIDMRPRSVNSTRYN